MNSVFKQDVIAGLNKPLKHISSKYFYDEIGDKLFQQIMSSEDYYLPNCELEILQNQSSDIATAISYQEFDVIELGAGDGSKTVYFLEKLIQEGKKIVYYPLDISASVLELNRDHINNKLPNLSIQPIAGDYFETLDRFQDDRPKVLLFMGANIGNYKNERAIEFLAMIKKQMNNGDSLLVGFDLRKNPNTILKAYNDSEGHTRAFNLNLLRRINRELDANFDLNQFDHYPYYDPIAGISYSFLVSLCDQMVKVGEDEIRFKKYELLHTEVSQKYSRAEIDGMQKQLSFSHVKHYLDSKEYFSVSVFTK